MAFKLLLFQPPVEDFYDTDIRLQPIGLGYLKASVKRFLPEIEVTIRDFHHGHGRYTIPVPKTLSYLKPYYSFADKTPFSTFYHYYHFGLSFEKIAESILAEKPDMVGISSLFSPYYREVLKCVEALKQVMDVPILLGGSHVSARPDLMLKHPGVDFVIQGEGELALVEFLKAWLTDSSYQNIPGLGFKKDGEMVLNPPVIPDLPEDFPFPDFSDFQPRNYLYEGQPLSFILTSRGCPHQCTFCSVHTTFGYRYRKRSVASIMRELRWRYAEGYRVFDFEDDNLTLNQREMKLLCEQIITEFPAGSIRLLAMNGISFLSLNPELLSLMHRAGFTNLNLSLVSADALTRQQTRRPHSLEKYLEIANHSASLGFQMVSYQILGLPGESLDSMINTVLVNVGLPVLLGASMFYLTPDSPIAEGWPDLSEDDIFKARLTAMAIETDLFKRDEIYTLFITIRMINFLKGLRFGSGTMTMAALLDWAERQDERTKNGAKMLKIFFESGQLNGVSGNGIVPIQRFQPTLFYRIWNQITTIVTQTNEIIQRSVDQIT
ncbi:MAG: B12-binding domain-containing radical SAM protein [SAR324 cluster bacterium]|nr:B12-binding domain-containing radical SAM protein [SAR324 cluster bacterium]